MERGLMAGKEGLGKAFKTTIHAARRKGVGHGQASAFAEDKTIRQEKKLRNEGGKQE